MPRSIRFHLDESCNLAIARALRNRQIDVTTSLDAGLIGAADPAQLAFATAEDRVLFTHDPDFIPLHKMGQDHPGIVFCRQRVPLGERVRWLVLIWEALDPEDMRNRLEYL